MRLALHLCTLLLLPGYASAQITATISGAVTDQNGNPLPDVNVFISGSMNGTLTDDDGQYRIDDIPLGALRLYVTLIGYEPQFLDIFIKEVRPHTFDFQLEAKTYELGAITVTADNSRWKRHLERFTHIFIGETPYAAETIIINPEVLDFTAKGGTFRAQASEPLIIENKALGYRITYFLNEFVSEPQSLRWDGEPLFESLEPETPEQSTRWNARRDSTFYGSFRHFLLAILNDQVEEQGFMMYSRPDQRSNLGSQNILSGNQRFPAAATEITRPGDTPNERILDFEGFIEVVYTRELEDKAFLEQQQQPFRRPKYQTSMIRLDRGPTIVDLKGDTLDPYGVTFYGGYFAYERIANEVPKEYRPWIE